MIEALKNFPSVLSVTSIVAAAGGKVVGRTRLQKIAYLLSATCEETAFDFEYKHFGPFSADLAQAVDFAQLAGILSEDNRPASWGGTYSIYETSEPCTTNGVAKAVVELSNSIDSVVLELAATAIFLSKDHPNPWDETKKRKPSKASADRIAAAKDFVITLNDIETPIKYEGLVS